MRGIQSITSVLRTCAILHSVPGALDSTAALSRTSQVLALPDAIPTLKDTCLHQRTHLTQHPQTPLFGATSIQLPPLSLRHYSSSCPPPPHPEEELVKAEVVLRDRVPLRPSKPGKEGASGGTSRAESKVGVGLITLWRPHVLNALCQKLMEQFCAHLDRFQNDPLVGAIVVTGGGKAFAAGADISEMAPLSFPQALHSQLLSQWEETFARAKKPVIAAVNGYALGGGCELAMMCDIILAGERAVLGQPEVTLGVIPGMGGTQRLVRAVGKSRAMEMVLGGECFISAQEAVTLGLASRVVPGDNSELVEEALRLGARMASMSAPVVALAKETVNSAFETTLSQGIRGERSSFYSCFSLNDQTEGMGAFAEKREPQFENK